MFDRKENAIRLNEIRWAGQKEKREALVEDLLNSKKCERCGDRIEVFKGRIEPNQIRKRRFCFSCGKARRIEVSRPKRMERTADTKGYVWVWDGDRKGLEHVLKAEKVLGRRLKENELV